MLPSFFKICCRELAQALRHSRPSGDGAAFLLGFDDDGCLFYKIGNTLGGQLMSVCTEPLAFCPFCGRRVEDSEAAAAGAGGVPKAADEEATLLTHEASREIETILALAAGAHDPGVTTRAADY